MIETREKRTFTKTPIAVTLSILLVAIGLIWASYQVMQNTFFQLTADHEMQLMSIVQTLGSTTVDEKLAVWKNDCVDMLENLEVDLALADADEWETTVRNMPLPEDGLNIAYWSNSMLLCWDDSYRSGLEALDIAAVAEKREAVIFNPYFDDAGNYIVTVAAATENSSGVLLIQYDGFCISEWLKSAISNLEFGTAYIVDSEGYNIATAREEDYDWITTRYNARLYAEQNPTTENVSIAELERLALAGETGVSTYEWDNNTSHVAYGPLEEAPWGYYVGFYESEFTAYTEKVTSVSGRAVTLILSVFSVFVGCILILLFRSLTRERKYSQELQARRAEAESRSRQDALTKLKNNRAWQETIEQLDGEIHAKANPDFAVAVCDVNSLKRINDTMGHENGDSYIIQASNYICKIFSHSPVYRIGGDEFAVILQGDDLRDCDKLIEKFDSGLASPSESDPTKSLVSIALGCAHYQPGDAAFSDVFQRADEAMYHKKAAMKAK